MTKRVWILCCLLCCCRVYADNGNATIRIGLLVTLSGPGKSWGEVNVVCARIGAEIINETGGLIWQGKPHQIELLIEDDGLSPEQARQSAQRLIQKNVRWVIGTNVSDTMRAVQPLFEAAQIPHITYAFDKQLFGPQHPYTFLGMATNFQMAPALFNLLRTQLRVSRVSLIVHESDEGVSQAASDAHMAQSFGMQIVYTDEGSQSFPSYRSREGRDARRAAEMVARIRPDAVLLAGATPESAPRIVRLLRDLNFAGPIALTSAVDESQWRSAERESEGVLAISNQWNSALQSNYFREFRRRYLADAGVWHDEATAKAYALETITQFMQFAEQHGASSSTQWLALFDTFSASDPFVSQPRNLRFLGKTQLGLARQLAVPAVIAQLHHGHYRPVLAVNLEQ